MNEGLVVCLVAACLLAPRVEAQPGRRNGSTSLVSQRHSERSIRWMEPISGVKVNFGRREMIVKYTPSGGAETAVKSRHQDDKGPTIMQKIGKFMMMIPIGMQLLQLPMAIASVKANLVKSILVAKVALFMILLRILLTPPVHEKVIIVKQPSKEYHDHYYNPYEDPEDNKPGWLGKAPSWLT